MNPFVIVLILSSSIMHASWNLLARRRGSVAVFIFRMVSTVVVIGLVPACISEITVHSIPIQAWYYVCVAGLCCGLYFFCLSRSYSLSDFTIVYPVARSLPVLFVALGDILLGKNISSVGWLGMLMVVAGCFLVPLRSIGEISKERYVNKANLWMLLTALGTVGYTLLDNSAAEIVLQGPATAARYGYFYFLFAYAGFLICILISRTKILTAPSVGWKLPILSGLMNFSSYWLILWSYQLQPQASYILAFRQTSIAIGVVAAFLIYKEEGRLPRILGTAILSIGLILIALFGR